MTSYRIRLLKNFVPCFRQSDRNYNQGSKEAQLLLARQLTAIVTALLLFTGAFGYPAVRAQAESRSSICEGEVGLAVLASPLAPWKGAPLRVIVAAEKPFEGELSLIAPDGSIVARSRERHVGPPYFWFAEVASPAAGAWGEKPARATTPHPWGKNNPT